MRFPASFLDAIRARIPISEVVGRRVVWDKRKSQPARGDFWACCPFHAEKTPSFHAEDRKGRYHCFGCGASGDHFTFLVAQDGMSFPEAVEALAREAGLPLPETSPEAERREAARAGLHEVLEMAVRFFEAALQAPEGAGARAYLRGRGLSPEAQQRFRIGYAPASRSALKQHLAAAGVAQEQMVEAGLLIAGEDIAVSYDRFRDRIIFPIGDLAGRVIAFGGRALSANAQAKYLNSPETPLFRKGEVLFNARAARAAARRSGPVIAVEGYIDVVACVAAGFEATVAPLGTALTEEQLRLLWQMADEPVLCFDGDAAGLQAAFRAVALALPLLAPGKSLRFALLPEGRDPDDLLRAEGAAALRAVLEAARPLVDMLWSKATQGQVFDTPERRAGLQRDLRSTVAGIADADVRRHYEDAVSARFEAAFPRQRRAPSRRGGERRGWRGGAEPAAGFAAAEPSQSLLSHRLVRRGGAAAAQVTLPEAVLIGCLLCHPALAAERLETLARCRFDSRGAAALAQALAAELAETPDAGAAELARRLEAAGHGAAVAAVLDKLRRSGLGGLGPEGDEARAARVWDDAAHLRLRAGTLSIERHAAAEALGRDAGDVHLTRLRDIQEQELRSLQAEARSEPDEAAIVHPFKR